MKGGIGQLMKAGAGNAGQHAEGSGRNGVD